MPESIPCALLAELLAQGMSRDELAAAVDRSPSTVGRWLRLCGLLPPAATLRARPVDDRADGRG